MGGLEENANPCVSGGSMSVATWPWEQGFVIKRVILLNTATDQTQFNAVKRACEIGVAGWAGVRSWLASDGVEFVIKPARGTYIRRSNEYVILARFGSGRGHAPRGMVNHTWEPYKNQAAWCGEMLVGDCREERFSHVSCHEMGHALGLWHEQLSFKCPKEVYDDLALRGMHQPETFMRVTQSDIRNDLVRHRAGVTTELIPDTPEACVYGFGGQPPVFDAESVMLYGADKPVPSDGDKRTVSALWGAEKVGLSVTRVSDYWSKNSQEAQDVLLSVRQKCSEFVRKELAKKNRSRFNFSSKPTGRPRSGST